MRSSKSVHGKQFLKMGHKLIGYHVGRLSVAPEEAIRYFDSVLARHKNPSDVSAFYRPSMAPGMSHLQRSPGPKSLRRR